MTRNPRLFVRDILTAIEAIEKFVQGMDYNEFAKDDKTSSAVVLKFQIIGEAAKQIPKEIRLKCPHLPWREMTGMRNRLIHAYFGIDYRLVWDAIKIAIPKMKPEIVRLLDEIQEKK